MSNENPPAKPDPASPDPTTGQPPVYGTPPAYGTPPGPPQPPAYGTPPGSPPPAYGSPAPDYGTPAPDYGTPPPPPPSYGQGGYPQPPGPGYPPQGPAPGYPYPVQPGTGYGVDPYGRPYSERSKIVAGILQLFLGTFGAGRWYTGHYGIAIAQLLTCGGLGIWALVDGIILLVTESTDADGRVLRS